MEPKGNPPVDLDGFRSVMRDVVEEEVVELTLAVYVEEAKILFPRLSAAVSSGDVETIRATAHTLKSSSGNIWVRDLPGLLQHLEIAAQEADLSLRPLPVLLLPSDSNWRPPEPHSALGLAECRQETA